MSRHLVPRSWAALAAGAALLAAAPAASAAPTPRAAAVCDAYAEVCAAPPVAVLGQTLAHRPVRVAPARVAPASSLPFTGAELSLVVALGLGGVGFGSALAVAGRRRRSAGTA